MARQARRGANLVPGASLRGLVFDSCYDNSIPHTFGMLQHFRMPNRNRVLVSESPHLDTAGLAVALRIEESEVLLRRYPPHGRGHCSFFGLHVMKGRIEDRLRRFSPAAIAAGILHHPATHELRDLPFSTVGWDMLQDTCPCEEDGVRQNWVTTNGSSRCHSCGGSLGRIAAIPVPEELRSSLEFIANLVDPDPELQDAALARLPAAIRGAGRTLLYDMVMNLARMVSPMAQDNPVHRTEALAEACRMLITWPAGLDGIQPSTGCPSHRWEWVRRNYPMLDGGGHTASSSTRAVAAALPAAPQGPNYAPSGSKGRIRTNLLSAMAAARLGGVDEPALKQAWDDGQFTQHVRIFGRSRARAFDPAEVVALAPGLRLAGSRAIAAAHIGVPVYGLEQLLELELFTPAAPGGGIRQLEAHRAAACSLVTRTEKAAATLREPSITLLDAIRHVSGRPKPWGAAFAALLDGTVPFAIGVGTKGGGLVGRISVARDAVSTIVGMPHDVTPRAAVDRAARWSGVDALECLNGNRSASRLLDGLTSTGTRAKRLFAVHDVLERAAAGVTTFDLARRSGVGTTRIVSRLEEHNVRQIAPGLWERPPAEQLTLLPGSW